MRKPIIAGNWKMNKTIPEGVELAKAIASGLGDTAGVVEVVVCPTATALSSVSNAVSELIGVGAQNVYDEPSGAYTGEISAGMILDAGATYVILGHSERRQYFHETDEGVNSKVKFALESGLRPIICVGERLEQREAGETQAVVETQVRGCLAGIDAVGVSNCVIAYEPVWAIGTGLTATPEQAQEVHAHIRGIVSDMAGEDVSSGLRIQYGGSMKPANAAELLAQPDIDGGLVGGASLDAESFLAIIHAAL